MNELDKLREKISNLAKQANHLIAEKGDQIWTTEEKAKFDNWAEEIERGKSQIRSIEKMRELDAENFLNSTAASVVKQQKDGIGPIEAVALYLQHGNNVTPEQALAIKNTMSTTTGSEGGYTVPVEISKMVIEKMKVYGGMREVAHIVSTSTGAGMSYPTSDSTNEKGEIVEENQSTTKLDISFGTVDLSCYNYSSKVITIPLQLVQDSAIDIVDLVTRIIAKRIGRITNEHFTTGSGTKQPAGIVTKAKIGKTGGAGQALTVTYDDLVDLKHSVNRAYRSNARYMMNDLTVAAVSKLKDTVGRPLWIPGVEEGEPDRLNGHYVVINDDMPEIAAGAKSIAFGDFSKYFIRDVLSSTIIRRFDDSVFGLQYQVGFCGWQRCGGNLTDTDAVKLYVNGTAASQSGN